MAPIPQLLQCWQEIYRTTLNSRFVSSVLLLVCLLFLLRFVKGGNKLNLPPSPPRLPIIGHLHLISTLPHRSFDALSKTYGPIFLLYAGCIPVVVVTSEKIAKEIFKSQDIVFSNRVRTRALEVLSSGYRGITFAPYGEHWKRMRSIAVGELLSTKRVQSFHFVREEETSRLIKVIRCASLDGASVNLGEMFDHISTSIISRCVLGRIYAGENMKRFEKLLRDVLPLMGEYCVGDIFPSLGWVDVLTGLVTRLKVTSKKLSDFFDLVIEEYQNSKGNCDHPDKKSFIEILLQLREEGMLESDITQNDIKETLRNMFAGGSDNVSTTMEWAMTQLIKNPSTMKKVQEEVRRVVGKKSKVDQDDVDQMYYLKCVVKETLRLNPPGPLLIPRQLATENVKLEGYDIPPKALVIINVWAIQRDPKLWNRPEEFLPERFANNPVDFNSQDFRFIPFGAGRRGCPGVSFGLMEAQYVLANLLFWFDWNVPGGASGEDLDMNEDRGIVLHRKIALQLVPVLHSHESLA